MFNIDDLNRLHELEIRKKASYGVDGYRGYVLDQLEKAELKARIANEPPIGQKKVAEVIFLATSLWKNYWSNI